MYGLNLFQLRRQRPSSRLRFRLGPISTAHLHERTDAAGYEAAMRQFVEDLASGKATHIDVTWSKDGPLGSFDALFGTNGVTEAAQTILDYCPRTATAN